MVVVASWTGARADALREALRMTNEMFAQHLGVAVRTVAYWRKRPDMIPQPAVQETLDAALDHASDRVKAQFNALMSRQERENQLNLGTAVSPDDTLRLQAIERQPSRLDLTAVQSLVQVLAAQRRVEDALGPGVLLRPMALQMDSLTTALSESSGPHRDALARLVAEWTSYVGWLHLATRRDNEAITLLRRAEDIADEIGDGTIAATAISFRGYLARLQGQPRKVIRASAAALATSGAHQTQRIFDMLQTAQGYASLGDKTTTREMLHRAADLVESAGEPPDSVYWYTESFFRLNIGMAQLAIGEYADATDSLRSGLESTPADQYDAEWMLEYRQSLTQAVDRTSRQP